MIKIFELYSEENENEDIVISFEDYLKNYENIFKDRYIDIENGETYKLNELFTGVKILKYDNMFRIISSFNPDFSIRQESYKNRNYIKIKNYINKYRCPVFTFRVGSILSIYDINKLIDDINILIKKNYYIYNEKKDMKIKNILSVDLYDMNNPSDGLLVIRQKNAVTFFSLFDKFIFRENNRVYNNIDPFGEEDWDD